MSSGYSDRKENRNVIVAGLWMSRNGHYHSLPIDSKGYDALQKTFEHGGKFLIRKRTAEAIQGAKDPARAPVAYLEFVPKEAVEEFEANKTSRAPTAPSSGL